MKLILSIFFFFWALTGFSQSAYGDGEWLSFKIKYGWFNTSTASLEIEKRLLNDEEVFHVVGIGKSVGLLDLFFKVRDRYETYITKDEGLPLKFIRDINEGGYKKNKELFFDHLTNRVKVVDFKHNTIETFDMMDNTQDMLSAFYKLRNTIDINKLEVGQEFYLNMFFDNENYNFKTKFLGYETIETKFGKVAALKFRPYVKAERVFEESESLTFWVSADKNKIPLKIEAELAVGSLTAELDQFKGLKHPFQINMD
ncbi:DUF3108 domain-containing protein [Psychroflexus sediminis]|uniref:ATP-dependent exonuclease n=1 Tax=Psychroflexus sediminis TaxID=470826 RepID=A0A1G7UIB2_9FLAO|nr:DUF3108 domain-containing protein [Psychroflexus sediminis]SDG46799.1 Protein of unknown function [Psychroflexus sediminis]